MTYFIWRAREDFMCITRTVSQLRNTHVGIHPRPGIVPLWTLFPLFGTFAPSSFFRGGFIMMKQVLGRLDDF